MTRIENLIVRIKGNPHRWHIIEARSLRDAVNSINFARVRGSMGDKSILDDTACGGGETVLAHVKRLATA